MANEFKRTVGSQVSKADAKKWIEKFDKERKKDTKSVFYGRDAIEAILSDETVTGISFMFCRKPNGKGIDADDLVLVGTREDGTLVWNDNAPAEINSLDAGSATYDKSAQCPPYCPQ